MNRMLMILLVLMGVYQAEVRAEIKTTSRAEAEAAFHYDDNILFPDSITQRPSFKHEVLINSRWYVQLTKFQLVRLGLNFWNEQLTSFPREDIRTFGADVQYRNFLSRKLMINTDARYHYQFSPSEFYLSENISGTALAGYYFGPTWYGQLSYETSLKRFLDYYRYDLLTVPSREYYSNSYQRQAVGVYSRYQPDRSWTAYADNDLEYKNYYDDRYDLDLLDSAVSYGTIGQSPFVDYLAVKSIASRESLNVSGGIDTVYDTTYRYGISNIQQRDLFDRIQVGLKFNSRNRVAADLSGSYRVYHSSDPYYRYQGAGIDASAQVRHQAVTLRLYYQLLFKYYSDRYSDETLAEQQRDVVHFLRLGISRPVYKDVTLDFQYTRNVLQSNYTGDEFRKNVFSVLLHYKN